MEVKVRILCAFAVVFWQLSSISELVVFPEPGMLSVNSPAGSSKCISAINASTYSEKQPDTLLAHQYFKKAKHFADSLLYDSAIASWQQAAMLYEKARAWKRTVQCYNDLGNLFLKKSLYDRALEYLHQAFEIANRELGNDDLLIAANYSITGGVYYRRGAYKEALSYKQKALSILMKTWGTRSFQVAELYNHIALVHDAMGNYDRALRYLENALDIEEDAVPKESEYGQLADTYNNLGLVYHNKGYYDEAAQNYRKALELRLTFFGDKHPKVAESYNNLGSAHSDKDHYKEALDYHNKALRIRTDLWGMNHVKVANSHNNIGNIYFKRGDYNKALEYQRKALAVYELLKVPHRVVNSYQNIGLNYSEMGYADRALEYYQKSLDFISKAWGAEHPQLIKVYYDIARIYQEKKNQVQALEYYQKSLTLALKKVGPEHPYAALNYQGIGTTFYIDKQYDEALEYYEKSLAIWLKVVGAKNAGIAILYSNIASVHMHQGRYDTSRMYYRKALELQKEILGPLHPQTGLSYHDIAVVYHLEKQDYDRALEYYQKAVDMQRQVWGEKHPHLGLVYRNMGNLYNDQQLLDQALHYYQKSIIALTPGFYEEDPAVNPSIENSSHAYYFLFNLLSKTAIYIERYKHISHDPGDLERAMATSLLVTQLIDKIRGDYREEKTKLSLTEKVSSLYYKGAQTNVALYKLGMADSKKQAFFFAEKNKAATLLDALNESQARSFSGIPDSLLQQEQELKVNLSFYETSIRKQKQQKGGYDTSQVQQFEDRLFDLKQQYKALIENFEESYPKYYELKHDVSVASVEEVQERLPDANTVLLSYFTGPGSVLVFSITKKDFQVRDVPLDSLFYHQLRALVGFLTDRDGAKKNMNDEKEYQDYASIAYKAYDRLLRPVLEEYSGIEKLIIVPDDLFAYLPFEALLCEGVDTRAPVAYYKLPYLIRKYQVRYEYSATLYARSASFRSAPAPKAYAGFAPVYPSHGQFAGRTAESVRTHSERGDLTPLEHNQPEVAGIAKIIGGKAYLATRATEQSFKKTVGDYRILHLAMHAFSNDENPLLSGLAFTPDADSTEDDFLHTAEIYDLPLQAELAVLSACNTGYGKLVKGEGVMSLARAFRYAGCPSVAMSLWKVDDESTALIMQGFYTYLDKGFTKDQALRKAKLDYLSKSKKPHPYFWAPFVLIGDEVPLKKNGEFPVWGYGVLALLVLSLLLFFKYRRRTLSSP